MDQALAGVEEDEEPRRDVEDAAEEGGEVLELARAVGEVVGVLAHHLAHRVYGEAVDDERDPGLGGHGDERGGAGQRGARDHHDHDGHL